jgi:hypothetical protein
VLFRSLFAFCLYALAIGSYELGNRLRARNLSVRGVFSLCATGLQFIPGGLLWLASLSNVGTTYTKYGGVAEKVFALQAPFTFGPEASPFDKAILVFAFGFLIVAIVTRAVKLAPQMRLPLFAMALTAVAVPNWLSGSWLADIRLPVALPFVIIASARLDLARFRSAGFWAGVAVALLALRVWAISETWRDYDRHYAEFRDASQVITPGARLLIVEERPIPDAARSLKDVPSALTQRCEEEFWHMSALAVIDRSAFIPSLFVGATPVRPTPRNAGLFHTQTTPLSPELLALSMTAEQMKALGAGPNFLGELPYWDTWPRNFDYVLWINFGKAQTLDLNPLQLAKRGSFFNIYRVVRPES